jgi:hemerythrin
VKQVFVEWSPKMSVQVKEIDEQHKRLVSILNRAYEAEKGGREPEFERIVNELMEFARVHFSTEEKYFDEFNYKGAKEHKAEHAGLLLRVLELRQKLDRNAMEGRELLDFLREWMENHFMAVDQKYVDCFKEHGLK